MDEKMNEKILNSKAEKYYGYDTRTDCTFDNELLVKITLCEYRELVKSNAQAGYEYEKECSKCYDLEDENKKLKEQNEGLRAKLIDMQDKIIDLPLTEADESSENNE